MYLFLVFKNKIPIVVLRDVCMSVYPSVRRVVHPSVRRAVVCLSDRSSVSMSFRGNLISNKPIDPKIGLNVGYGVVHV